MAQFKVRDVSASLKKKGFIEENSKDVRYIYYDFKTGEKTKVSTMISHGGREIDDFLIGKMSRQMNLSKKEFAAFIECNLTKEHYREKLKDLRIVD